MDETQSRRFFQNEWDNGEHCNGFNEQAEIMDQFQRTYQRNREAISQMEYDSLEEPVTQCGGCGKYGDMCECDLPEAVKEELEDA